MNLKVVKPNDRSFPYIRDNPSRNQVFPNNMPGVRSFLSAEFDISVVFFTNVPHPIIRGSRSVVPVKKGYIPLVQPSDHFKTLLLMIRKIPMADLRAKSNGIRAQPLIAS